MEIAPSKKDIENLFKKLRGIQTNKICFDCTTKNPTWASVTYGVFICLDCSAVHRSLGVHLSFVRSTQLDTNWTWPQLRQMQLGGNANAEYFFHQHNCTTKDSQQKYNSRAAQLYKDKLHNAALQSIRLHGSKIQLDQEADIQILSKEKDFDFFDEQSNSKDLNKNVYDTTNDFSKVSFPSGSSTLTSSASISTNDTSNKHIIGTRKVNVRKSGLGKKGIGGLGAQKITTNFAEIEKEAELVEKMKIQENLPEVSHEDENEQITSMRLVYEDLNIKQKQDEEKMKSIDPSKAKQMERLGMGFTARSVISHSALSDMKKIEQENIIKPKTPESDDDFFELDFTLSTNSNSDFLLKNWSETRNTRNIITESKNISSLLGERQQDIIKSNKFFDDNITSNNDKKRMTPTSPIITTDEAQKKFGSAKSISSDQYFSNNSDNTFERSTNLSRFEGSSSISSADYFNRNENHGRSSTSGANIMAYTFTPDLDDVKESVRQGVTKVAGRLSSIANGVMSSIQEKYAGYY